VEAFEMRKGMYWKVIQKAIASVRAGNRRSKSFWLIRDFPNRL